MHPFFNQQLAQQHMRQLQQEADMARRTTLATPSSPEQPYVPAPIWHFFMNLTTLLSARTALSQVNEQPLFTAVEIKPALSATFACLREKGLVSEYDECFVELFSLTLEKELTHQSRPYEPIAKSNC